MVSRPISSKIAKRFGRPLTHDGVSGASIQLLSGLTAFWKLEDATGGPFVDSIGGLELTLGGGDVVQWLGRIYGKEDVTMSARFADIAGTNNSWLTTSSATAISFGDTSWTLGGWFMTRLYTGTPHLISKAGEYALSFEGTGGRLRFGLWSGAAFSGVEAVDIPNNFDWIYVEAYFDADLNEIGLKINNGAAVTAAFAGVPDTNSNAIYFGSSAGSARFLRGAIQGVGFWNRLLTAQESAALYNDGFGFSYPFSSSARVTLTNNTTILRSDAMLRNDKTAERVDTPNGSYTADPIIFTRTISGTKYQIIAYWDNALAAIIGVRSDSGSGFGDWSWKETGLSLAADFDGHEVISVAIDADGFVHIAYDNRNDPLRYVMSNAAIGSWDGTVTTGLSFTGANETEVTYAMFFLDGSGGLHVTYREGFSGDGDQYLKSYSTTTDTWSDAIGTTDGFIMDGKSSDPDWSPYMFRSPELDSNGLLHFVWTWRETLVTSTDKDIHHARWNPTTGAWTTLGGVSLSIPFNPPLGTDYSSSLIVVASGTSAGVEPADFALDSDNIPHITGSMAIDSGITNLWHFWFNGASWVSTQITDRTETGFDELVRPSIFITPNDTVAIAFVDNETYDRKMRFIYAESPYTLWTAKAPENIALATGTEGGPGPLYAYDRYRMRDDGVLDFLWFPAIGSNGDGPMLLTTSNDPDAYLPIPQVAPTSTSVPVISGDVLVGETLTCAPGTWIGTSPITLTYQWYGDAVAISGATSTTYVPVMGDVGAVLYCIETASNAIGSASQQSNSTLEVTDFLPTQISDLYRWLSPIFSSSVLTSISPDVAATNGQTVTRWVDLSGISGNANQTSGAIRPTLNTTLIGSNPAIVFDGTGTRMTFANEVPGVMTYAFVAYRSATAGRQDIYNLGTAASQQLIYFSTNTTLAIFQGTTLTSSAIDPTVPAIYVCVFNGVSSLIRRNGIEIASGDTGSRNTLSTVNELARSTNILNGAIGEWIQYNRALNSTEIGQLESYLSSIRGIAI